MQPPELCYEVDIEYLLSEQTLRRYQFVASELTPVFWWDACPAAAAKRVVSLHRGAVMKAMFRNIYRSCYLGCMKPAAKPDHDQHYATLNLTRGRGQFLQDHLWKAWGWCREISRRSGNWMSH
jgi:hypothetical protein